MRIPEGYTASSTHGRASALKGLRSLGGQYSRGRQDGFRQLSDFIPEIKPDQIDLPLEDLDESEVSLKYDGFALFLGFTFNFIKTD